MQLRLQQKLRPRGPVAILRFITAIFYAPRVGLKNPSWVSLATISLGVLCYDWPGCKYMANENARNKNMPPGARRYRRISYKLCSRFCNLNTQLSSSYIEQNQTKLLQKDKSTTNEIFYILREIFQRLFYHILLKYQFIYLLVYCWSGC